MIVALAMILTLTQFALHSCQIALLSRPDSLYVRVWQAAGNREMAISKGWKGNNVIQGRNKAKKRVRPVGHRSVEVGLGLCFQQK